MFEGIGGAQQVVGLTLYTDAFLIRGNLETRQRRVTDMLNLADERFLVLADVTFDEFGPRGASVKAEFAQVNLDSVLFALAEDTVEAAPELRTPKVPELALISIPPFKITGEIHLLPERTLREALTELTGHYLPVTNGVFWSDTLGEARQTSPLVAVNHARAQILAPHRELDPWAGLDTSSSGAVTDSPPTTEGGW
jgi:hypothetical protein